MTAIEFDCLRCWKAKLQLDPDRPTMMVCPNCHAVFEVRIEFHEVKTEDE